MGADCKSVAKASKVRILHLPPLQGLMALQGLFLGDLSPFWLRNQSSYAALRREPVPDLVTL